MAAKAIQTFDPSNLYPVLDFIMDAYLFFLTQVIHSNQWQYSN